MLHPQQIRTIRIVVHSLFERCNIPYKVVPYDHDLHQECIDEAVRRGYQVEGKGHIQEFLRAGVVYAQTAGGHLNRSAQIWIALYIACLTYVDEVPFRFPAHIAYLHAFSDRFFERKPQLDITLDAFADLIRRTPDLFLPIPSRLIAASSLNFPTGVLLEHETTSMKIVNAAQRYPAYQRIITGAAEAFAYLAFPRELPLIDYVQAIPEVMLFVDDINDVLSFYKEELAGETVNQVATLAARDNESHLNAFQSLSEVAVGHYRKIMRILEGSPEASETFKQFSIGYFYFHTSLDKYRIAELDL